MLHYLSRTTLGIGDAACLARLILEGCPDPAAALRRERRAAHVRGMRPTKGADAAFPLAVLPGAGCLARAAFSLALRSEFVRRRLLRILGAA